LVVLLGFAKLRFGEKSGISQEKFGMDTGNWFISGSDYTALLH
jgi:hypothetical protein